MLHMNFKVLGGTQVLYLLRKKTADLCIEIKRNIDTVLVKGRDIMSYFHFNFRWFFFLTDPHLTWQNHFIKTLPHSQLNPFSKIIIAF